MLRNESQCLKKRSYVSATEAHRVVEKAAKRGTPLRVYRCPNCKWYHVTSKRVTQ